MQSLSRLLDGERRHTKQRTKVKSVPLSVASAPHGVIKWPVGESSLQPGVRAAKTTRRCTALIAVAT